MTTPVRILGLDFFQGSVGEAVRTAASGGLVVAPSGPGLATLPDDAVYRAALTAADVCLLDSGLLAGLWESKHLRKLDRISGYNFLVEFLKLPDLAQPGATLWVAPTEEAASHTRQWLAKDRGLIVPAEAWHVAPQYDVIDVKDEVLLKLVLSRQPRFIFIGVGGGPQEKLGAWLKSKLNYRPAILCTGAAIAFLTGEQARIPAWADQARLGWLLRCLHDPRRFIPRYWQARKLVSVYRHWGEQLPTSAGKS
jgi:N-acetylglucosaminyldiphosphoundecaprenol N-acetyl-beta-D-mannosaminyltransferase